MAFSFTGLAYLLGFFAVGLLTYRFFQYWQREKTTVSKLLFYFVGFFAIFMLITAIAGLFFAKNTQILRWVVILAAFIQTPALSAVGYLVIYLKFPKISPWVGFIVIFLLGLAAAILDIFTPFNPYLERGGGINWAAPQLANNILLFIFLITLLPLFFILIQQARTSEDPFVKARGFGLGIAVALGAIVGFFDFFLEPIFKLRAISSDIALGFFSLIVIMTVLFTQKVPPPKKEEKYIPPSPKIPW